jgi:RHS repeat-associated protein
MLSDVNDSGGSPLASFLYDPLGNRVYKWSSDSNTPAGGVKYIVDVSGELPTILCEMDYSSGVITNKYYYAGGRVLKQDSSAGSFYYVHDRLGSVRLVTDANGAIKNSYTYNPFGADISAGDCIENIRNPFKFTGQWYDSEFGWYYLRARMYDPGLGRFTSRDPVLGKLNRPLSLHKYLYCKNEPLNMVDPKGQFALNIVDSIITGYALYNHGIKLATYAASSEDWRFFDLAKVTFDFIPAALALSAVDPFGPIARICVYVAEDFVDKATGFTWGDALAVDVVTYAFYIGVMSNAEEDLDIDGTNMEDFIRWKKKCWE